MEKKDIALKQLRTAAQCYKKGDYVSCITLSGAAEEILGRISKKRKGFNQLGNEIIFLKDLYDFFSGKIDTRIAIKKINSAKNELKHNHLGENIWVEADFENEACSLFVKAVKNYFNAYNEMPKDRIINSLFNFLTL